MTLYCIIWYFWHTILLYLWPFLGYYAITVLWHNTMTSYDCLAYTVTFLLYIRHVSFFNDFFGILWRFWHTILKLLTKTVLFVVMTLFWHTILWHFYDIYRYYNVTSLLFWHTMLWHFLAKYMMTCLTYYNTIFWLFKWHDISYADMFYDLIYDDSLLHFWYTILWLVWHTIQRFVMTFIHAILCDLKFRSYFSPVNCIISRYYNN